MNDHMITKYHLKENNKVKNTDISREDTWTKQTGGNPGCDT